MCIKRLVLPVIAAFIAIFAYEFVFHGILLQDLYAQTANLWRTHEEMNAFFPLMLGVQFGTAIILSWIFVQHFESKGLSEGLRYGLWIGIFYAIMMFGSYIYMPIPLELALAWAAGGLIEGILIGVVLSLTYKGDKKASS